jgi:hypothetical protein
VRRCTTLQLLTDRPSAPLYWRRRYLTAVRDLPLDTRKTRKPRRKAVTA